MKVLVALSTLLVVSTAQVLPYYGYPIPTVYAAAPAAVSSQYHAQDELGQFSYGYTGPLSSKTETKRFDGATVGSYNYIDANGVVQTASYVADPVNGFRVSATNLPVAPVADQKAPEFNLKAPVFEGVAPKPVQDSVEVAAAKAKFRKAYAEAAAAAEAAPDTDAVVKEAEAPVERQRRNAILYHAAPVAKTTFKTATLDKVEADTPADTTLLEVKEKEHEAYVPAPVVYHAAPVVTYHAAPVGKTTFKTASLDKVEADTPADTTLLEVKEKEHEAYVPVPIAYHASPVIKTVKVEAPKVKAVPFPLAYTYGAPLMYYNVQEKVAEEKAEVPVERQRRSTILYHAAPITKTTFKTASLDKVEADTPADTTLLKIKENEHEAYVPTPVMYHSIPVAPVHPFTYSYGHPFIYNPVLKAVEEKSE